MSFAVSIGTTRIVIGFPLHLRADLGVGLGKVGT